MLYNFYLLLEMNVVHFGRFCSNSCTSRQKPLNFTFYFIAGGPIHIFVHGD